MSWLLRVRNVLRPNRLDRELEEELRHHLAMRADDQRRAGMDAEAAQAQAERMLGNTLRLKERMRDMDLSEWLDTVIKDVRYAGRQMRRSPGFTTVAVLSLALGIGANTGIFSLLNTVLMKSLPVKDPGSLVILSDPESSGVAVGSSTGDRGLLTYREFEQLRDRMDVFEGMFATESGMSRYDARINGGAREEVHARLVTGGYFAVLGVTPELGRFFNEAEDRSPGQDPFAVLSYDFWQRRFAGSPAVLGTVIQLGRANLTVIGVARPRFWGETVGQKPDLWAPMMMQPQVKPGTDWLHEDLSKSPEKVMWLHVFGRLKPGMTVAAAQAQANVVFKNIIESGYGSSLSAETRKEFLDQRIRVRAAGKGASVLRDRVAEPLMILLAVVGLVLLIACANIANLMLARAAARNREMGVRLALGAGRSRLIRQLLTESILLAALGSAVGLLVAEGAIRLLISLSGTPGSPLALAPAFDLRVLGFTIGVALITAMLFGLAPALRATRLDLNSSLEAASRGVSAPGSRLSFTKSLVAVQVGLSLLLLVGAGLFLRTLQNLKAVNLGYPKDKLAQVRIAGVAAGYKERRLVALYREIRERLQLLPGVRGVAYSENGLFAGTESGDRIIVEGFTPRRKEDEGSRFDVVGPYYFSTIRIPVLLGREFGLEDTAHGRRLCVINEAFAKKFFQGRNPIGRHITAVFGDAKRDYEVIGIAANARDHELRGEVPPRYYVALDGAGYIPDAMNYQIRTAASAETVISAVRKAVQELDENLPVLSARPVGELVEERVTVERTIAQLSAIFGAIALVLACIGLYGVLSYGVARRTSEIGIRMALGAKPSAAVVMILKETSRMVAAGIAAGLLAAAATTRFIASRLFEVAPLDPITVAVATVVLVAVALIAGFMPAQRAARVNPATALRHE